MFKCIKKNKRMIIIDNENNIVYSLPDFLRNKLKDRSQMINLANKFNEKGCVDIFSIMEFESMLRPVDN